MEYRLTEQQQLVKNTLNSFLDKLIPEDQVRDVLEKGEFSTEAWNQLAIDGWLGMLSSQDEDFSLMDLIQVSEIVGRKLYLAPFSLVASYIVPVLSQLCSTIEKEEYLQPLIKGEKLMTTILPVLIEEENREVKFNWGRLGTVAGQEEILLSGTIEHVPFAQDADQILVPIQNHPSGFSLAVIRTDAEGLSIHSKSSIDYSRRVASVTFNDVAVEKEKIINGNLEINSIILEKQFASYIQCLNSEMIGGAEKVLNMTVDFVKERKQFGQPIGGFQAVKHIVADMSTGIENAKALNNQTTWRVVNGLDFNLQESYVSRVYTTKLFKEVCESAIQIFGGMGFTWEQDIHFWYKSALYHQNHIASTRKLKRYIFNNFKKQVAHQKLSEFHV